MLNITGLTENLTTSEIKKNKNICLQRITCSLSVTTIIGLCERAVTMKTMYYNEHNVCCDVEAIEESKNFCTQTGEISRS